MLREEAMLNCYDKIRVVIADDDNDLIQRVLSLMPDQFEIVATVNDGLSAVQAASRFNPDIIILDIMMPGIDGIEVAREMNRLGVTSKVIFLTALDDDDYVHAARVIGASFVQKRRMRHDLTFAMKEMLDGRTFASPSSLSSPQTP